MLFYTLHYIQCILFIKHFDKKEHEQFKLVGDIWQKGTWTTLHPLPHIELLLQLKISEMTLFECYVEISDQIWFKPKKDGLWRKQMSRASCNYLSQYSKYFVPRNKSPSPKLFDTPVNIVKIFKTSEYFNDTCGQGVSWA